MPEEYNLYISADKMSASLAIIPASDQELIAVDDVMKFLNERKVIAGIKRENIRRAIENKNWGQQIVVAEGIAAVQGKDGYIRFFFDPDPGNAPREREDGSLDFHHLNKIQNISKGEKLAEIVPSVEGVAGMNIFGEQLKVERVKSPKLIKGKNTRFDDKKTALIAEMDGIIILRPDGTIEVSPQSHINGDIDLSTGDLEIKGDLIIDGDIKSGFKVSASGNIVIGGAVEEAAVTAGGSVTVRGGFVGEGGGIINAGGDVYVKFVTRQKINAGGNLEINEEARGAQLTAGGALLVRKGKGILAGGSAKAGAAIEVNTLGSPQNVNTMIIVADTSKLLEQIATRQKEIEGINQKAEEIAKKMQFLTRKKKKVGLKEQEEDLLRKFNNLLADIQVTVGTLKKEIKEAETAIDGLKKTGYLKVFNKTYPGVTMKIAGSAKFYDFEREATTFKVFNGDIIGLEEIPQEAPKS